MGLEDSYFGRDYSYNRDLVERLVSIIQNHGNAEETKKIRDLVFRMMKEVVKKNIANYLNLLRNSRSDDVPERDDLVADCFFVFDLCVDKYVCGTGKNFYFYYNSGLSRYFFRNYKKEQKRVQTVMTSDDDILLENRSGSDDVRNEELFLDLLGLTDTEKRICMSKISGQRVVDFLSVNEDITPAQYSLSLRSVRMKIAKARKRKEM